MSTKSHSPASNRSRGEPSRRRSDRIPVGLEVVFQPTDQAPRVGKLVDLSPGGACIATRKVNPVGEALLVYLPYPSQDEPTGVTATVRWSEPESVGLQFTLAEASQLEAVTRLLENPKFSRRSERPAPSTSEFSRDELLAVDTPVSAMKRRVRFQEVDAAGTIYYSRVLEYFGDVYVELLERDGLSLPEMMAQKRWFAPLVHAEVDYLAPMRFGDHVVVEIAKTRAGTSAITVGYRITGKNGRPLAVGHTVHVFVDGVNFRPCPVPPEVRRAVTRSDGLA